MAKQGPKVVSCCACVRMSVTAGDEADMRAVHVCACVCVHVCACVCECLCSARQAAVNLSMLKACV